MNILIFSWRDPKHPLAGGAEQSIHEHSKGWVKKGNKVTLLSSRFKSAKGYEILDGIEIIRRGSQYLGVQIEAFLFYIKNKQEFDLVIDQFHGIPFFTPLYVKHPKLAVIQEVAKEVWFFNHFKFPLNFIVGLLGYILEPLIFGLYKNMIFITASDSAKKDLISFGIKQNNIYVINHGVSVVKFKKSKKEKEPTIIYLGRLSKDKGIEDALKTFELLYKKNKNYSFWVVGKGETKEYEEKIKKKAGRTIFKKKIKFLGYVDEKKKFELLSKAHILINPSKREGWGLVNIEANVTGTPVVAYKSAGLIDSVKHGLSGIISNSNPADLASNVQKLISDKKLYSKLSKGAIKWGKNFTWEKASSKSLIALKTIRE